MLKKGINNKPKDSKFPSVLKSSGNFVIEVIKIVVISLAIIIPVRYFLIQPFYVKGASMEPNFHDYEYLIIDEISYRFHEPIRGDVVVIGDPNSPARFFIKRVIGLPGERIEIKDGSINIYNDQYNDGFRLDEAAYLPETTKTSGKIDITLSEEEYYVLGDNRNASLDSRIIGPVTKDGIVGRAWIRAWPLNKIDKLDAPEYNN